MLGGLAKYKLLNTHYPISVALYQQEIPEQKVHTFLLAYQYSTLLMYVDKTALDLTESDLLGLLHLADCTQKGNY